MKKIGLYLLASASLLLASCAEQKPIVPPPVQNDTALPINPDRNKVDVPGQRSILVFRPDSQKVETKLQTCFFIYSGAQSCLYVTVHRELFAKIEAWLPEVITNPKNCVVLEGTLIDPFTLITREELDQNAALKKILELNGYRVYAIFNYANYPNGISDDVNRTMKLTSPIPGKPNGNQSQPVDNGRGVAHQ